MALATTKQDLVQSAQNGYEKMMQIIASMSKAELSATFNFTNDPKLKEAHWQRDRNVRDVMIHLYEWHRLLIEWIRANGRGEAKPFLPEPYNWRTYGDMNIALWQKHQHTPLQEALELLRQSHSEVLSLIVEFSNEALFAKNHFAWTGASTLGSYCVSATSSHYDWAIKKLKKHISSLKK